jgi:predicted NodU family carbamoyl transferase
MTRKKDTESEIILAKVEERLDSYMKHNTIDFNKLQTTTEKIETAINNINNILHNGEKKIADVRWEVNNHLDCHERQDRKLMQQIKISLGMMSVLVAIITATVNFIM